MHYELGKECYSGIFFLIWYTYTFNTLTIDYIVKSPFDSMKVAFYRTLSSNAIAFLPEGIFDNLQNLDSL